LTWSDHRSDREASGSEAQAGRRPQRVATAASSEGDPQQKCFLWRGFRLQSRALQSGRSQRKRGHEQQDARADDM